MAEQWTIKRLREEMPEITIQHGTGKNKTTEPAMIVGRLNPFFTIVTRDGRWFGEVSDSAILNALNNDRPIQV